MKKIKLKLIALFLLVISLMLLIFILTSNEDKTKNEKLYHDFIAKIKSNEYVEGFQLLYPLVKAEHDPIAMQWISRAYLGSYGIDMDMIKANIWAERSKVCYHCETGTTEYNQYEQFLKNKEYGMASVFLQKSAEKGNKHAIDTLQNKEFLIKNKLTIDENWVTYWDNFDYDNLYPFEKEIRKRSLK